MTATDAHPITYLVQLDGLDGRTATFLEPTGLHGGVFHMPRKDWEDQGRPGMVTVTVAQP